MRPFMVGVDRLSWRFLTSRDSGTGVVGLESVGAPSGAEVGSFVSPSWDDGLLVSPSWDDGL